MHTFSLTGLAGSMSKSSVLSLIQFLILRDFKVHPNEARKLLDYGNLLYNLLIHSKITCIDIAKFKVPTFLKTL